MRKRTILAILSVYFVALMAVGYEVENLKKHEGKLLSVSSAIVAIPPLLAIGIPTWTGAKLYNFLNR